MNAFLKKAEQLKPKLTTEKINLDKRCELSTDSDTIFDFGTHLVGYPEIRFSYEGSYPDSPVYLKVSFAEYQKELDEDSANYKGWVSKAWIQEEFIHIDEFPYEIAFSRRYALRYVKITVLAAPQNGKTVVDGMSVNRVTSAPDQIALRGGTELEKAIDKVSLLTLSNCMQTEFEDGPKRDRRLWLGDLRLQALANYETFKHNDLVKRCLYLFAGLPLDDGRVCQSVYTKGQVCGDGQTNFDYSLLFIPTLLDYLNATNDTETVKELLPTAKKQIEVARTFFSGDVIEDREIGWCFLDWSLELSRQAGAQAVYVYSERALIEILKGFGEDVSEYEKDLIRKIDGALTAFYDKASGLIVSGKDKQVSYASNVWFVLSGILSKEQGVKALENMLMYKGAIKPVTPYMMHHYVQALIDCGLADKARTVMNAYWGGMVEQGADTFWEMYNPENPDESPYGGTIVHSYCHAWSCTPCYFIRNILFKEKIG